MTATALIFWIACNVFAAPPKHPEKQKAPAGKPRPNIVFVQTQQMGTGKLAQRFPKGSAIVRLNGGGEKAEPVRLTDGFFAAADPQVNFDGAKILFSAQKNQGERWQIWEMGLDGGNKRQITKCAGDCLRGAYLPAGEIAFTAEEAGEGRTESYVAVVKMDGSGFRRITFGPAEFELETVLRDGRIVATAPWPLIAAKDTSGARSLYTLRPDGTALESFRCEHRGDAVLTDASELEDGSLVFVKKTGAGGEMEKIQRGAASSTAFGAARAVYEAPRQIASEELIVSKENVAAPGGAAKFDLYTLNAKTGALGEKIFGDARLSSIQAVPVAPHDVPKHYWSTLNPESLDGFFVSLDSYLAADVGKGRITTPIAQVRVLTANPGDGADRSLGVAPVESDGSFYVKVPANAPIRFVLLDVKGQTIREERGWVWTRPGEQRGCTGCHGDKAVAPENHWPQTLRRFDTPTVLGESEHGSTTAQAK